MGKVHAEVATPLGHRAQVGRIALHLCQRGLGVDNAVATQLIHSQHFGALGVEVAQHIAHELLRHDDGHLHHRFQQDGAALFHALLEGQVSSKLEGDFGRVHRVRRTIVQSRAQVRRRVTSQTALFNGLAHAFLHRGNKVARNVAAKHLIHELEPASARQGFETHPDIAELSTTTGLLFVAPLHRHGLGDGFLVGHLGGGRYHINAELGRQALDGNVDVRIAHSRDNGFVRVCITLHGQRRIFFDQASQCGTHLVQVGLGLGADRRKRYRMRKDDARKNQRVVLVAQCVRCCGLLQLGDGADVTSDHFLGRRLLFARQVE